MSDTPKPRYRAQENHLYRYDSESRSYIHCFSDYRLKSKQALIKAYERKLEELELESIKSHERKQGAMV